MWRSLSLASLLSRGKRNRQTVPARRLGQLEGLEDRLVPAPIVFTVHTNPASSGWLSGTGTLTFAGAPGTSPVTGGSGDLRFCIFQASHVSLQPGDTVE